MKTEKRKIPRLYFVIPCYNESENVERISDILEDKIKQLKEKGLITKGSGIFFVDDGSNDDSFSIIKKQAKIYNNIKGISLDKNSGQQVALYAGMLAVKDMCDIVISMDCDGQNDPEVIEDMIHAYFDGNEIVCAVRSDRKQDGILKSFSARIYYSVLRLLKIDFIKDHADYRLVSTKAIEMAKEKKNRIIYLRGDLISLPVKKICVEYKCQKRMSGTSKYSLMKMFILALAGIASQGMKPIIKLFMYSFMIILFALCLNLLLEKTFSVLLLILLAIGGLFLLFSILVAICYLKSDGAKYNIIDQI